MEVLKAEDGFTEEEITAISEFRKKGCPGVVRADETKVFKWFELYMSGKTYLEISAITGDSRELILYMSHRMKWYVKRMQYYQDLNANMIDKLTQTKIDTTNTLASMIMALNKYYADKFNSYIATGDSFKIDSIDTKLLGQYYKSIDSLQKLLNPNRPGSPEEHQPVVNINVGKDSTQDVQVNSSSVSDILKALSLSKDEEDKKKH